MSIDILCNSNLKIVKTEETHEENANDTWSTKETT